MANPDTVGVKYISREINFTPTDEHSNLSMRRHNLI